MSPKEIKAAYDREYSRKNKDRLAVVRASYNQAHKEQGKTSSKKYRKKNPDKFRAYTAKRKAAKLQRMPKWLSDEQLGAINAHYETSAALSQYLSTPLHVDHIIPLRGDIVSGLHVPWNLQLMAASANCSKKNKFEG